MAIHYGASWYPEHKSEEDFVHDLKLLIESGINTVRMGEFAWCKMEPKAGEFHFGWLKRAVDALGEAGIQTILCTPTACPPAWLIEQHPDILYMDNRRVTRPFGGRRHYCYNSEAYRKASAEIVEAMAAYFADNPHVAGWQIDNEPAQEGTGRCCCPTCTKKFQNWLSEKYQTIEAFNERSGGIFWSQDYTGFHQINPPVNSIEVGAQQSINAFYENPTVRLEFERFSSDSQISYQNLQVDILRTHTKQPVTTNATGLATNSIDYFKSTKTLDNYAFDFYPSLRDTQVDPFPYAFARGIKEGKPFWVLEFMSGGGHRLSGSGRLQPNPGALKQAVLQSFVNGAEMMMHFQFRSFPMGAEQLNYAIVDLDGVPRRRYREMQETAALLKKLESAFESKFYNEVGICVDYDSHWALRIKPVNDPFFKYFDYCGKLYRALSRAGVTANVVSLESDWSGYKVMVVPAAFLLDDENKEKLRSFVAQGGTLVSTFLTGVKNRDNIGATDSLPSGLTDLFGAVVAEVEPVFDGSHASLWVTLGQTKAAAIDGMWSELLETETPIAHYTSSYKAGGPVAAQNSFGKGTAYYFGTDLPEDTWMEVFASICDRANVHRASVQNLPGIEVVARHLSGKEYLFLLNFATETREIPLPSPMTDACTGETHGTIALPQNGFAVLTKTDK